MRKFNIGDQVKIRRTGLDVEIVELHPKHESHVLCAWIDYYESYIEAYFNVQELELVKAANNQEVKSVKN